MPYARSRTGLIVTKGIEDSASGKRAEKKANKERARTKGKRDVRARSVQYQRREWSERRTKLKVNAI